MPIRRHPILALVIAFVILTTLVFVVASVTVITGHSSHTGPRPSAVTRGG
jgi:hypothetical protein